MLCAEIKKSGCIKRRIRTNEKTKHSAMESPHLAYVKQEITGGYTPFQMSINACFAAAFLTF